MKQHWPRRPRRWATVAAVTAAVTSAIFGAGAASAAPAAPVTVPAAAVAASCSAAYSVQSDWGTGFTASITVTNTGTAALTGWSLSYSYTGNQQLTQGWSGTWSQAGKTVTVSSLSYNSSLAPGASTQIGANFSYSGSNAAPASVGCTAAGGGGGGTPPPAATITASPASLQVTQGTTGTTTLSLSTAPSANVTVTVARTSGNTGLSAAPATLTFTPADYATPRTVTISADTSSTGAATFTASGGGYSSATITATETASSPGGGGGGRVADPYNGAEPYLNPDYTAEVQAQATKDGSSTEAEVANHQTAIWMDHIGAIAGDNRRLGLKTQLDKAEAQATSAGKPVLVEVVVYDLPGRDCAALASNGEIPATAAGLTEYESQYIDPLAAIEGASVYSNLRIVNIIEPDSLPNAVTNQSIAACQTATPLYEQGIEYALNKLHAINWAYNYLDIGHSGWLGWTSNFTPAIQEYAKVATATTAGFASVDGFISNTANYIPTVEPYMTATETVGGNPVDSVQFYSYDPQIEELTYDQAWRSAAISAGFSSSIGMLIDTSRNGWGGPNRPAGASTLTSTTTFVNQSKIDQRPFRGDWCNVANAGIGARPQDAPADGIQAFVWIKPPGESDGTYPAYSGEGDPHCDPNGTQTDGSGNSYPTDALPDPPPAGQWFPAEFSQLVANAYPALP
jgi:cellulose 1,4-beta-cellobiosidase